VVGTPHGGDRFITPSESRRHPLACTLASRRPTRLPSHLLNRSVFEDIVARYHIGNILTQTIAHINAHNAPQTQTLHHNPLLANLRSVRKHSASLLPTHQTNPLTLPVALQINVLRFRHALVPRYPHAKTPPRQPSRRRIRPWYVNLARAGAVVPMRCSTR
jgi:hypothetical protein